VASWKEHFDTWHQIRKINLQPIDEEGQILAGRDAEDLLRRIVDEHYSFKDCHSFAAKRVPDPQHKRRREIDLIVVTAKRLYVIECKNWTGTLSIDGDRWVQRSVSGRERLHEDVLSLNTFKMNLLVQYLQDRGIEIEPDRVCQKLIFMNPKLKIASMAIAKNSDVITPNRLEEYLARQNNQLKAHEKLFSSVIGLLLDEELKGKVLDGLAIDRVGGIHHDRLIQEVGKLATWDKIFLHGTKILSGDIIDRSIPNLFRKYPKYLTLDRAKEIRIGFVKSKWLGLIKAFLRIGRPIALDFYDPQAKLIAQISGNPDGNVLIHEPGSRDPTPVNLCEIDRIVSGRHIANDNRKAISKIPIKTLLALAIGSGLFFTPVGRDSRLFIQNQWSSVLDWWMHSSQSRDATSGLNSYTGNYDFGRYSVKVFLQKNQLFAETATGKAKLNRINVKNGNEFTIISQHKGNLGKYVFVKNQQGQVQHLIWVQNNGQKRKCPKI
jgi:Nuclease-related domain